MDPLKEALDKSARESFLFRFETFGQIKSALEEVFSPSAASVILYVAARKCGERSCKRLMEKAETKETALSCLSELKSEENWGKLSFRNVDFEKGSGKVTLIDSFETVAEETCQPGCHFFKGFLTGFLSELFAKTITVTEEKCAGKGDKHCEFTFE